MRVFGSALSEQPEEALAFYFDFDVTAGTATEVQFVTLSEGNESSNRVTGRLSPDGRLIPVYLNALWTDAGSLYGAFALLDLDTGARASQRSSLKRWAYSAGSHNASARKRGGLRAAFLLRPPARSRGRQESGSPLSHRAASCAVRGCLFAFG
ncbi:MAG: hypothetical protein Kow00120_10510 [Anaerolineae bacterium]